MYSSCIFHLIPSRTSGDLMTSETYFLNDNNNIIINNNSKDSHHFIIAIQREWELFDVSPSYSKSKYKYNLKYLSIVLFCPHRCCCCCCCCSSLIVFTTCVSFRVGLKQLVVVFVFLNIDKRHRLYKLCQRFRPMKRDDYFRVTFEHFLGKRHYFKQLE